MVVTPIKPLPGAENAGKPGYYTVKPGDTLIRIGLESGQSWKDIARWNNLENANLGGSRQHYANFQDANMEGCTGCPTTWECRSEHARDGR